MENLAGLFVSLSRPSSFQLYFLSPVPKTMEKGFFPAECLIKLNSGFLPLFIPKTFVSSPPGFELLLYYSFSVLRASHGPITIFSITFLSSARTFPSLSFFFPCASVFISGCENYFHKVCDSSGFVCPYFVSRLIVLFPHPALLLAPILRKKNEVHNSGLTFSSRRMFSLWYFCARNSSCFRSKSQASLS